MKYPQNPSGMLFMQLLRKRTREVKPLLALDFIFGMSADPYFSFLEVCPANNIISAVWQKAFLMKASWQIVVCIFLTGAIKQESVM